MVLNPQLQHKGPDEVPVSSSAAPRGATETGDADLVRKPQHSDPNMSPDSSKDMPRGTASEAGDGALLQNFQHSFPADPSASSDTLRNDSTDTPNSINAACLNQPSELSTSTIIQLPKCCIKPRCSAVRLRLTGSGGFQYCSTTRQIALALLKFTPVRCRMRICHSG